MGHGKPPPVGDSQFFRCFYQRDLQRESFALPRVAGVAEEAAAEHANGVRQCRVINPVVLCRVF